MWMRLTAYFIGSDFRNRARWSDYEDYAEGESQAVGWAPAEAQRQAIESGGIVFTLGVGDDPFPANQGLIKCDDASSSPARVPS